MSSSPAARVEATAVQTQAAPRRPAPARLRARRQRRLAGGVVWIVLVAALLAGVVAMNVAVLRLNVQLDGAARDRANLRAENAALESALSSAAAGPRIETLARGRLGLVPAEPSDMVYVELGPKAR